MLLSSGLEHCGKVIRERGKACNSDDLVSRFEFVDIGGGDFGDCGERLSVGGEIERGRQKEVQQQRT